LTLAEIYLSQNDLSEVKRCADRIREWLDTERDVSRAHNIELWQSYYQLLVHYYRARGDDANAWISNDSLERKKQIAEEEYNLQQLYNAGQQIKQRELDEERARSEAYRRNLLTAAAFVAVMLILLLLIMYHNRRIAEKNRAIVRQIRELQKQQERTEQEGFIPDSRRNQFCVTLRNLLLKDKIYRTPTLTRDRLATQLGVNKDLFHDLFRSCFEMPFNEYINALRLKDAIVLLEQSDCTVDEISEKTGFGTVRTFQRQFQNKYNMSPKQYRKACISSK
jgi:AraC-like DNA-binding protein